MPSFPSLLLKNTQRLFFSFPTPILLNWQKGNHDCLGSADAQVAYTRVSSSRNLRPRWHMPAREYVYNSSLAKIVVLDTCLLFCALEPKLVVGDHCHFFGDITVPADGDGTGTPIKNDVHMGKKVRVRSKEARAMANERSMWLQRQLASGPPCRVVVTHVPVYSSLMCM